MECSVVLCCSVGKRLGTEVISQQKRFAMRTDIEEIIIETIIPSSCFG